MLKTKHLQMPNDEWHNLHNLAVSIESAISSCSDDQFGSDVRMEIQGILERAQKKIQRVDIPTVNQAEYKRESKAENKNLKDLW